MSETLGVRAAVAQNLKGQVQGFLHEILQDEAFHAEVVASGEYRFRAVFVRNMGVFFAKNRGGCDDLANSVYRFCLEKWIDRHPDVDAKTWLDAYAPPSPLTEAEIDEGWEVEIASDESAMAQHYEGSARTRKGNDLGVRSTPLPGKRR